MAGRDMHYLGEITESEKVEIEWELASEVCPGLGYSDESLTPNLGPPALLNSQSVQELSCLHGVSKKALITNTAAQPSPGQAQISPES